MRLLAPIIWIVASIALAGVPGAGAAGLPDDPTNRVEGNNPSIAQKVLGLDAWMRATGAAPDVLMLGSSRSVMLDPHQVHHLTGRTAFNAGISSGAARELLAMTEFADLRSAGHLPHLVVLLDLEAFDNRRPTTRVLDYQRRLDAATDECAGARHCMLVAAHRLAQDALARQRTAVRDWHETQRADGRQINGMLERLDAQGVDLTALRARRIEQRVRSYRPNGFDRIYPEPQAAFERLLALANARGIEPVIVITTMHPACILRCGPAGWSARRTEVRGMLDQLGAEFDFRVIDLSYPAMWGGSGRDFLDEIHLRPLGAARVVRRLVRFGAFGDAEPR